jgi:hypothetical protein
MDWELDDGELVVVIAELEEGLLVELNRLWEVAG